MHQPFATLSKGQKFSNECSKVDIRSQRYRLTQSFDLGGRCWETACFLGSLGSHLAQPVMVSTIAPASVLTLA